MHVFPHNYVKGICQTAGEVDMHTCTDVCAPSSQGKGPDDRCQEHAHKDTVVI